MIPLSERFNEKKEDIRYSKRRKLDVDKLGLSLYNEVRLDKKEYATVSSAAKTADPLELNTLITRPFSSDNGAYTYCYYFDDNGVIHIVDRYEITNIHERKKDYDNSDRTPPFKDFEESGHRQGDGSEYLDIGKDRRKAREIDAGDVRAVQGERDRYRSRYPENAPYNQRQLEDLNREYLDAVS